MALVPFPSASPAPPPDDEPGADTGFTATDELEAGAKMSFLEHLEELRTRLIRSTIGIAVGCVIAFIFLNRIFEFVMRPLQEMLPQGGSLITTEAPEFFMLYLKVGFLVGAMIAFPFVVWQFWLFVAPGLYAREKRLVIPFVVLSTVCFAGGALFAHYIAFPWTWRFFIGFTADYVQLLPRIGPAFGLYVKMLLAFSVVFQIPTLVFFLSRIGVLTAGFMIRNFKYAVLVIAILGAILSPPDVVSQMMVAGPMLALYTGSILIAWLAGKRKDA